MRPAFAILLAAVLALSGCGGSKNSSSSQPTAASWTDDLCSALVSWENSLKSAGSKFKSGQMSKSSLQATASDVSKANQKLKSELQSLGKPPATGAAQAKSSMSDLSNGLKANVDKIQQALSGISSAQDIAAAVSAIGGAVSSMGAELSSTTKTLQSLASDDPWRKAYANSASCQKLAGH